MEQSSLWHLLPPQASFNPGGRGGALPWGAWTEQHPPGGGGLGEGPSLASEDPAVVIF